MSTPSPLLGTGRFGRCEIVLAERSLQVDGRPVNLGSRAFDLLAALVTRRDRVVPKDELIDVVWPGLVVEDNNLQVQISALRKVLGAQAIATVPGRGYQFTIAATATDAPPSETAGTAAPSGAATAAAAPAARSPHLGSDAGPGRGRSRLLVADDNKVNRLLLCRSLELMGHSVTLAENGRVALAKLQGERFDLLLLDLEMPELDGFGLLEQRAADAALREVPVIVTSSLEGVAQIARCIELGADDYLHKPVNPLLLKARVESSLERKHLRDRERELLARLAPVAAAEAATAGRRVEATLVAARLRGFDAAAAAEPAEATLELLGGWSTLMLDAVEGLGGQVTQMSGDGIVAVFGAGAQAAGLAGASAAARAAMEMHALTAQLAAERMPLGTSTGPSASASPGASRATKVGLDAGMGIAIGIATGEVLIGQAGPVRHAALVCIGAAMQRAGRLETLAHASPALLAFIDAPTQLALGARATTVAQPAVVLPGSSQPVVVHALQATAALMANDPATRV